MCEPTTFTKKTKGFASHLVLHLKTFVPRPQGTSIPLSLQLLEVTVNIQEWPNAHLHCTSSLAEPASLTSLHLAPALLET